MSRPSADRKLAIPYLGPCRVTKRLSGTLRTIRPEGYWCRQLKDITVSLNRVKRCYGENRAPQKVDHDLRRLEDAEDNAEGPTRNLWVVNEGAAFAQALDQEAGDIHAPSFLEKSTSAAEPQPAPRLLQRYKDPEDMALPVVVHHERTSVVGPEQPGAIRHSAARIDSTTMTDLDPVAPSELALGPSRTWSAPRTQFSVNQSALVRQDSSPVMEPEVSVLPPALEELRDDIFMPSPSPRPRRATSTTATAPSTTDMVPSTTDTAPDTDGGSEDRRGQKQAAPSLDTSYSQEHRATIPGPSNYPERHFRRRLLTLLSWGPGTLSRHAHHHLGTPILLSNNDRQFVHPIWWIPDSKSPQSRVGLRPSHQPVRHSLKHRSEGSISEAPATPKRRGELPRGEGRGTTEGTPTTHPAAGG